METEFIWQGKKLEKLGHIMDAALVCRHYDDIRDFLFAYRKTVEDDRSFDNVRDFIWQYDDTRAAQITKWVNEAQGEWHNPPPELTSKEKWLLLLADGHLQKAKLAVAEFIALQDAKETANRKRLVANKTNALATSIAESQRNLGRLYKQFR